MILLRPNGGLGNQMFQYAFSRCLAKKYCQQIAVDFSQFQNSNRNFNLDMFPLDPNVMVELESIKIADYQPYLIQEEQFNFTPEALSALDDFDPKESLFLISGYWQSPKYFAEVAHLLKDEFARTYKIGTGYRALEKMIANTQSVMIHVRRGDYLHYGNFEKHGIIDIDYIHCGMSYYRSKPQKPHFFFFSDDILWCKTNIINHHDISFVEEDTDEGRTSFTLMRQCKNFIISNSTFSWWAAWLADFPGKTIIAPKNWFRINNNVSTDLIPADWLRF